MMIILEAFHLSLIGGRYSGIRTAHKILLYRYNCPTIHKDGHNFTNSFNHCQSEEVFQGRKNSK